MSRKINNVLTWLESSAQKYPNKTAFADETHSVTYCELVSKARALGSYLAERVKPVSPIAVLGNKTVDTVIAFFGVVYAGCYYVPLNPAHPEERRARILNRLGDPLVLVTDGEDETAKIYKEKAVFTRDGLGFEINESMLENIRSSHIDVDPLYVIFTSGSTGEPKGIAVAHRSVIDFIEEFTDIFGIDDGEVIANQAPFDFDVSVKDIYSTVKAGATMQIIPKAKFSFPVVLIDYLIERKVTTLIWAVSALCIISGFRALSYKAPETIRKVLFSGEAMPVKQLNYWKKYYPDAMFVNLYGPTEITCNCTYHVLDKGQFEGESLPIGKPFPNERVSLIGDDGKAITDKNVTGEICVSGTCVSLGYYDAPEETAKAFVSDPSATAYAQRMYRTGDLGYYGDDGLLMFVGRRDFQIKHMGHRIELSEIDGAIGEVKNVSRAVSVFDGEKKKLYAFYIGDADAGEIAAFLRTRLPAYMVPQGFIKLDAFPLTENGKTDRRKLLELAKEAKHG